jgi:hypothetical protein
VTKVLILVTVGYYASGHVTDLKSLAVLVIVGFVLIAWEFEKKLGPLEDVNTLKDKLLNLEIEQHTALGKIAFLEDQTRQTGQELANITDLLKDIRGLSEDIRTGQRVSSLHKSPVTSTRGVSDGREIVPVEGIEMRNPPSTSRDLREYDRLFWGVHDALPVLRAQIDNARNFWGKRFDDDYSRGEQSEILRVLRENRDLPFDEAVSLVLGPKVKPVED